jgi:hypothetical protein
MAVLAATRRAVCRFPLVAERIDESAHTPAVFYVDRRRGLSTSGDGLGEHRIWIVDHEEHSARRTADGSWDRALGARTRCGNPERGVVHCELGDDVISLADAVQHPGVERRLIERKSRHAVVDPKLGLDRCHGRTGNP